MENNPIPKSIHCGLIWVLDYFDGWLPACAGMTDFFVMYGVKIKKRYYKWKGLILLGVAASIALSIFSSLGINAMNCS